VEIPPPRLGSTRMSAAAHRFLARHSDDPPVRAARQVAESAVALLHSENPDPRTNGEFRVVRRLAPELQVAIDVGANRGRWAAEVLAVRPGARVYCSEIVGPTRESLRRAVPGARVLDFGLWDREGEVDVKHYPGDDRLSSAFDYPHPHEAVWRREPVRTGDRLVADEGIETVDLLKVDAEGADLAVLRGFRRTLEAGRVRVAQFEYGYASVLARTFLLDFYELLGGCGYRLGKVQRDRVRFCSYRLEHENFFGPNYLGVHESQGELLARLGAE
jgi:FkbM family methyltransferase